MIEVEKQEDPIAQMQAAPQVKALLQELGHGLTNYWRIADDVLKACGVTLKAPPADYLSLKSNFFSFLFLYSFSQANIEKPRRILYAAAIQCQRGMVTGCDNLLDDEYKKTLDTDIPETGHRFRSVIDIMVSDRVLFQILLEAHRQKQITADQVAAAATASMKTMTRSGVQEASEEAGIDHFLKPDELLKTIHHYKTGLLFQCPWDIPLTIERLDASAAKPLLDGLYQVGMGCQILDDMVDMMSDLWRKRHNYMVSLIHYGNDSEEKNRLDALVAEAMRNQPVVDPATAFPLGLSEAYRTSRQFLESGLALLFPEEDRFLAAPSIQFLQQRIGVAHLIPKAMQ